MGELKVRKTKNGAVLAKMVSTNTEACPSDIEDFLEMAKQDSLEDPDAVVIYEFKTKIVSTVVVFKNGIAL